MKNYLYPHQNQRSLIDDLLYLAFDPLHTYLEINDFNTIFPIQYKHTFSPLACLKIVHHTPRLNGPAKSGI